VDDPGAVSVHGVCGALGTLLVGVFATDGGLLYGGGFEQLEFKQLVFLPFELGQCSIFIVLIILKKTMGLRVTKEEEIDGLIFMSMVQMCTTLSYI
jgi:Amt family ammonium transporter